MESRLGRVFSCVCLLALLIGGIVLRSWQICDGHFGYPIDDTYIHMAMAKNFALHGVWGVTRYAFSSSTSSPLFTLMLAAAYFIAGVHQITPFLINFVLAIALIAWCVYVLDHAALSGRAVVSVVCLLILSIPLYAMTLVGMEHILHMLLTLVFVHLTALLLTDEARLGHEPSWRGGVGTRPLLSFELLALAPLLVMARYEGTFLVLIAGVLFLVRRQWGMFVGLGVSSAAPLIGYAAIAMSRGWYALPNSLLLKANLPGDSAAGFERFLLALYWNCITAPHIPLLLLAALVLVVLSWKKHHTLWTYSGIGLVMFLTTGSLHMMFARVGWYFRYEAYLVAFGGMTIAIGVAAIGAKDVVAQLTLRKRRWAAVALGAMLIVTLGFRTARSIYLTPRGIRNIFDQQYQSALFIRQFYPDAALIVNDIGAVCFLTDAHVFDAIGLGNMEPAIARMHGTYSSQWLASWARRNHAELAIAYSDIQPPPDWPMMGKWTIPDRWVVGRAVVNVYAIDPHVVSELRKNLQNFQRELPRGVLWTGM